MESVTSSSLTHTHTHGHTKEQRNSPSQQPDRETELSGVNTPSLSHLSNPVNSERNSNKRHIFIIECKCHNICFLQHNIHISLRSQPGLRDEGKEKAKRNENEN